MRMRRVETRGLLAAALVGGLAFGSVHGAAACGHCVEDKVAATYDYGVVTRARAAGHHVYYFAVVGRLRPGDAAAARAIVAALASAPGVDPGTARVSTDPAAVSFAAAPAARAEERVPRAVAGRLGARGLSLRFLTSVDGSSEASATGRGVVPRATASGPRSR